MEYGRESAASEPSLPGNEGSPGVFAHLHKLRDVLAPLFLYAGLAGNPEDIRAKEPPQAVETITQQLRMLLQNDYAMFEANPTQQQGLILTLRILAVADKDEAKSSPALMRSIGSEAMRIARIAGSNDAMSAALAFVQTRRVMVADGSPEVYSADERKALLATEINSLTKEGKYRMALDILTFIERQSLDSHENVRTQTVAVLSQATLGLKDKTDVRALLDIAESRSQYARKYFDRYRTTSPELRDESDVATAKKLSSLSSQGLTMRIQPGQTDILKTSASLKTDLTDLNKAIISFGRIETEMKASRSPSTADYRIMGRYAFTQQNWDEALDYLRKGGNTFDRYDPERTTGTSEGMKFYAAGIAAWQDADKFADQRDQDRFKRYGIGMLNKAVMSGNLDGIASITSKDLLAKNGHLLPTTTIPVQTVSAVSSAQSPILQAARGNGAVQSLPASTELVSMRGLAEKLVAGNIKIGTPAGGTKKIEKVADIPAQNFVISAVYFNPQSDLALLDALRQLGTLTSVHFYECNLSDAHIASLVAMPQNVTGFSFMSMPVGKAVLTELKKRPSLSELSFNRVNLSDEDTKELAAANLSTLELSFTNISDAELASIAQMRGLRSLSFQKANIGDAQLSQLLTMPALSSLDLRQTRITDAGVSKLGQMKGLQSLRVEGASLSKGGVELLRRLLPNCKITSN